MKKALFFILVLIIGNSCKPSKNFLVLVENADNQYAYLNANGDTIIPFGKYEMCFTDTIKNYGIVMDKELGFIGINIKDELLFKVMNYDNGPDYISDGMFRIVDNGKIGFADEDGKIVIAPQYECAYPFENGQAKVSLKCSKVTEDEHEMWNSEEWFFIDKKGEKIDS